jgi:hypothetical protein
VHHGPLEIESIVLKALLNAALRSINYMAIFMQTFVRGAIFIGAHEVFSGGSLTESFVNYIRDNVQR